METINQRIKRLREAKRMSQTDLGKAAGVKYQSVQEWERTGGTAPHRKRLEAVAKALGVSPIELMTGKKADAEELQGTVALILEHVLTLPDLQQKQLLKGLRALNHANKITKDGLNLEQLLLVPNERIEETYGAPSPGRPKRQRQRSAIDHPGDPDAE